MTPAEPQRPLSFTDYLAIEHASDIKHEFLDGEVRPLHGEARAMAGSSLEHALIAVNVGAELRSALRGRPCRVFGSDIRVRVPSTGPATHPDVSVVSGAIESDPEDAGTLLNPLVLVEVFSPSSEAHDRGEKFAHYRRIPSLCEYVLVSQSRRLVEVFSRTDDVRWAFYEAKRGTIDLPYLGCTLALDEVYLGVLDDTSANAAG